MTTKKLKVELADVVSTQGYEIHSKVFDEDVCNKTRIEFLELSNANARYIFNDKKNDKKRKSCPPPRNHPTINRLIEFLKVVYPELNPSRGDILFSKEGCKEQQLHTDYEVTDELVELCKISKAPLSVILSIMDGTKIKIKPFNSDVQIINLGVGDVFVFRADLVHAGCAYDKENVRFHLYLDSNDVKRVKNRTFIV